MAKAPPDGHTLLVGGVILWVGPLLQKDPPYDAVRDFAAVSLATTEPTILVVHPSLPVKSVKELIALAKARPGDLNYSSGDGEFRKRAVGQSDQGGRYPGSIVADNQRQLIAKHLRPIRSWKH